MSIITDNKPLGPEGDPVQDENYVPSEAEIAEARDEEACRNEMHDTQESRDAWAMLSEKLWDENESTPLDILLSRKSTASADDIIEACEAEFDLYEFDYIEGGKKFHNFGEIDLIFNHTVYKNLFTCGHYKDDCLCYRDHLVPVRISITLCNEEGECEEAPSEFSIYIGDAKTEIARLLDFGFVLDAARFQTIAHR